MARTSSVAKEMRRARIVARAAEKRNQLRAKSRDVNLTEEERQEARVALNKMPRDTSPYRQRNRCQLTGRCRGFLRKFQVSRLCFRELAANGLIPGITKASW